MPAPAATTPAPKDATLLEAPRRLETRTKWVLIRALAPLYFSATASRPIGGFGTSPGATALEAALDSTDGDRWRVIVMRPLPDTYSPSGRFGETGMAIRAFVSPDDLIDVTTRAIHTEFRDGTHIAIAAGVPVETTTAAGEMIVGCGDLRIHAPIPADTIGTVYETPVRLARGQYAGHLDTDDDALHYGLQFSIVGDALGRSGALWDITTVADGFLATAGDDCVQIRGHAENIWQLPARDGADAQEIPDPSESGRRWQPEPSEIHDDVPPRPEPHRVAEVGAPVYDTERHPVGTVLTRLRLPYRDAPHLHVEGQHCFVAENGFVAGETLCLDVHDVTEVDDFAWDARTPTKRSPQARLVLAQTEATRGATIRDTRRAFAAALPTLQACYQGVLPSGGKAGGEVVVSASFDSQGRSVSPAIEDTVGSRETIRCMQMRIEALTLPGEGRVRQALVLDYAIP